MPTSCSTTATNAAHAYAAALPKSVRLINRDVTLTTDSLDYDLGMELGWYAYGGKIDDRINVLTSIYGQYSPASKDAEFYHDVVARQHTGRLQDAHRHSSLQYRHAYRKHRKPHEDNRRKRHHTHQDRMVQHGKRRGRTEFPMHDNTPRLGQAA